MRKGLDGIHLLWILLIGKRGVDVVHGHVAPTGPVHSEFNRAGVPEG